MTERSLRPVPPGQAGSGAAAAPAAGARRALIVANDTYDHASLSQLRAPEADARALAEVLGDPEIGGFEVSIVHNAASYEVQSRVEDLFADSRPDDLLLLHFSGHGLKSDSGELFIAARNTRPDRLASTSVPADFVQRCMRGARARTIVLFLDCCYGGAFGEGVAVRAAGPVNVMESFPAGRLGGGRGRAVISASSAMEYAFEGTTLTADHEVQPSIFTSAVVDGLQTGAADRDEDGLIALSELYDYVFDRVREQNPRQTPGRDVEMSGEVYLARSRRKRVRAVPIPESIATALRAPDPTYRRGAVLELRDRLGHANLGVALGALEALQEVVRSDTRLVADDAAAFIAAAAPRVSPTSLHFDGIDPNAVVAVERELTVSGLPLAREVHVDAEPPLAAVVDGDTVTVTFSPTGQPYAGSVTVTSATGSVVVPVTATLAGDASVRPSFLGGSGPAASTAEAEETMGSSSLQADAPAEPAAASLSTAAAEGPAQHPTPRTAPVEAATTRVTAASTPSSEATALGRPRLVAGWVTAVGGLVTTAGIFLPWVDGQTDSETFQIILGPGLRGLLGVAAGITLLAPRARREVALGLLFAVTAVTGIGILVTSGVALDVGGDAVRAGWGLAFLGQLIVTVCGVVTIASAAWSSPLPKGPLVWRDPAALAVMAMGLLVAVLLASYAAHLGTLEDSGYGSAVTWIAALATGAVTVVSLIARPPAAGRVMLLATAVGTASFALAEWVFRTTKSSESREMPWLVVASLGLAVAALFLGRRRPATN